MYFVVRVNKGLFLTANKISEKMCWEYNVIICIFFKASLHLRMARQKSIYTVGSSFIASVTGRYGTSLTSQSRGHTYAPEE